MKCVLVNLRGGTRKAGTLGCANIFEPIGLLSISAYLNKVVRIKTEVIHQLEETEEEIFERIISAHPDVVGFSVLTVTLKSTLRVAEKLKKWNSKIKVIFGGDHPTANPEIVQNDFVDFVISGEGEIPFSKLIDYFRGNIGLHEVPSLSYWKDGFQSSPRSERIRDINRLPFPERNNNFLQSCRVGGLMNPFMTKQKSVAVVAASRGCPFTCSFCNNENMWERMVRFRDPIQVVDEIETLVEKHDTNTIFFTDLTFNASKKYTIKLCQELYLRNLPINWYTMCNLSLMDKELSDAMAKAKCSKIGLGIESFIPETMKEGKGGISVGFQKANVQLKEISESGIFVKGYFIIGFPWETIGMFDILAENLSELEAHEIRIGYFVPFPGTILFDKYKTLIDDWNFDNWSSLDKPVVKNEHLSAEEIQKYRDVLYDKFYDSYSWLPRLKRLGDKFNHLKVPIEDFLIHSNFNANSKTLKDFNKNNVCSVAR